MCFRYFYLIEASVWVLHSISPHFSLLFPPRLLPFYHFCVRLYPFTLFYCISSFSSVFLSYRLPSSFSFPYLFVFRILTYLLPLRFSISSFLFSTTSGMTLHGSLSHFFVHLFVFPILSFFFYPSSPPRRCESFKQQIRAVRCLLRGREVQDKNDHKQKRLIGMWERVTDKQNSARDIKRQAWVHYRK